MKALRNTASFLGLILLIFSVIIGFNLSFTNAAQAADTTFCQTYANDAVNSFTQSQSLGCGFSGPAWQSNFDNHYNWCLANSESTANRERHGRDIALMLCRPPSNICATATNGICYNVDGTVSTILTPGTFSATGCGPTVDIARQYALASLSNQTCLNNNPTAGCCTYTVD